MNIDFILPVYSETLSMGSYVHFNLMAKGLAERGHHVVIRTGSACTFSNSKGSADWSNIVPSGPCKVGGIDTVYYDHISKWHPKRFLLWFMARWTVWADVWKLNEAHQPIDLWQLAMKSPNATFEVTRNLQEKAEKAGISGAYYTTYALGPNLPMKQMIADAKKRNAIVVAGYFPFRTAADAVQEGNKAGVPVWIVPLFHAQDQPHQNLALHQAARNATGILTLCPFNVEFFEEVLGCKNVICMHSAPPPAALPEKSQEKENNPYCVVFGRFHAGKNVGEAIRIIDTARRSGIPNLELKIIAKESPEMLDYLPPYASVLSDISTEKAMQTLDRAEALLFPSLHESFGIVCIEALRCGTPAIIRRANHATYSIFEEIGLENYAYENENDALLILKKIHKKELLLPPKFNVDEFTWPQISAIVEKALMSSST